MAGEQPENNERHGAEHLAKYQFKKGQSGNPSGRPKGTPNITSRLRKLLEEDDGKLADVIAKVIVKEAAKGKFQFLKELMDRIDGKVPDKQELDGENRITVRYVGNDGRTDDQPD